LKHQATEVWGKSKQLKKMNQAHRLHPCLVETKELEKLGNDYLQNDLDGYIVSFGIEFGKETK